ncbi:MAG: hypothetical protein RL117_850 [Verrucomicrobiota bacterium]|jgi:hypothetical protein
MIEKYRFFTMFARFLLVKNLSLPNMWEQLFEFILLSTTRCAYGVKVSDGF